MEAGTLLLGVMFASMYAWAASTDSVAPGGTLAGVIRDAQGVAQMGAMVQVLGPNAATVATAFTDAHGRYAIGNLAPGRYLLRASATLFVPASRGNLVLRRGSVSVVDLTLSALFDTTSWLPAQRRRADEPADDWKWTLRSTANRPILRIVEDGTAIEISSSAIDAHTAPPAQARQTFASGDGGFGEGGVHEVLALRMTTADGGEATMRADLGSTHGIEGAAQSQELEASLEHREPIGNASRALVSYRSHPELASAGHAAGLQVLDVTTARRMVLGDALEVEAGGSLQALHGTVYGLAAHPFVRISTRPVGGWTVQYRMATDPELQGFDDAAPGPRALPVALVRNGRLTVEQGRHQEVSATRRDGKASVAIAYYHDRLENTAVAGGEQAPVHVAGALEGMVVDPATGSFRVLGAGSTANGLRVTASAPLTPALWVATEYSSGEATASTTGADTVYEDALRGLESRPAEAVTVALKGRLVGTGTRVRASYRWQPASMVTAVDPYSAFGDQAYLSCLVRQPVRWGKRLPEGLQATIDVTNLLAEGYRPFVSADGQTLYFAQAPRTIQAGLSFSF